MSNTHGSGKKSRASGWHDQARRWASGDFHGDVSGDPSRWDLFLRGKGLSDAAALELIGSGSAPAAEIRSFVKKYRLYAFVPEAVLEALGMLVHADEGTDSARIMSRRCDVVSGRED
jgi:hypothetical protein